MTEHKENKKLDRAYAVESMIDILYREIDEHWENQPFYLELIMENLQKNMDELIKACKDDDWAGLPAPVMKEVDVEELPKL